jgi:hypothetical protein
VEQRCSASTQLWTSTSDVEATATTLRPHFLNFGAGAYPFNARETQHCVAPCSGMQHQELSTG